MNVQVRNFTSATTIPAMLAPGNDEMLALVNEYRVRDAAYRDAPLGISREEEERLGDESNVPFFKLRDETPKVTSLAGAIAAIELVYEDGTKDLKSDEDMIGAGFAPQVLKACLDFLKTAVAHQAAPDPVFAAIEEFKAVAAAYEASPDDPNETTTRLWGERCEKFEALAATLATTDEGRRQQLHTLRDDEEGCLVDCGSQFVAALLNIVNHQLGTNLTLPE